MLKSLFAGLALAGALCTAAANAGDTPLQQAVITGFEPFAPPDGEIRFEDGTTKTLRDFPGELVLATVWFTTCPGCQIEMPRLRDLAASLKADGANIRVLPISIDGAVFRESSAAAFERIRKYYKRRKLDALPVVVDTEGQNASMLFSPDPVATPTTFFISPAGKIVAVVQGAEADWSAPESIAYLKSLAGR